MFWVNIVRSKCMSHQNSWAKHFLCGLHLKRFQLKKYGKHRPSNVVSKGWFFH